MTVADRFDLQRFVTAQALVFETVLAELRACRKRTHWMWFVFPQLSGLGRSSTARFYGISSIDEARAYLAHPVLGPRLDLCTRIVLASESASLHAIFGSPDDMKFRSCMTGSAPTSRTGLPVCAPLGSSNTARRPHRDPAADRRPRRCRRNLTPYQRATGDKYTRLHLSQTPASRRTAASNCASASISAT